MALTDIAKKLKETFSEFEVARTNALIEEKKKLKEKYGEVEDIRIGEMNYLVINDVYRNISDEDGQLVSPLFYNSINHDFAIIDSETSSTLIDEVYSRVTYMQRVCQTQTEPTEQDIMSKLNDLIDRECLDIKARKVGDGLEGNVANIFQCHLIKDTGVSAAPDTYSFLLKSGDIKEIPDSVMQGIRRAGKVKFLSDHSALESNTDAIQKAVFDKYMNSDIDIQNVNVKSIFEIRLPFSSVAMYYSELIDKTKPKGRDNRNLRNAVFNTLYIKGESDEFESLNKNIHVCDSCGRDIIDIQNPKKVNKIHANTDALSEEFSTENEMVYASGCEDCLVQCEKCGGWHFNYDKFIGTQAYANIKFAPGRSFIKGLKVTGDINYCSCRKYVEWIYDEKTGDEFEHDVIPIEKMAFINTAGEKIASYNDYKKFLATRRNKSKDSAIEEQEFARKTYAEFRKKLSSDLNIDLSDISVTSADKCEKCIVCNGEYYRGANSSMSMVDEEYRCDVCYKMDIDKLNMVTRVDGIVFLRKNFGKKGKKTVSKYVVTKMGRLRKISTMVIGENTETVEEETEEIHDANFADDNIEVPGSVETTEDLASNEQITEEKSNN